MCRTADRDRIFSKLKPWLQASPLNRLWSTSFLMTGATIQAMTTTNTTKTTKTTKMKMTMRNTRSRRRYRKRKTWTNTTGSTTRCCQREKEVETDMEKETETETTTLTSKDSKITWSSVAVSHARDIVSMFRMFVKPEIDKIVLDITNLEGKYGFGNTETAGRGWTKSTCTPT